MTDHQNGAARMIVMDLRLAGTVERYHTWPTIRRQTVAEHTWQLLRVYTCLFGPPDQETFLYIMFHDSGEIITGDPPYPVKRNNPELRRRFQEVEDKAKTSQSAFWGFNIPLECKMAKHAKIAELIEMAEEGMVETTLGSRFGWTVAVRTLDAAYAMLGAFTPEEARAIRAYVLRRLNFFMQQQFPDETAKTLLAMWREF
jgi:hypothetical protein